MIHEVANEEVDVRVSPEKVWEVWERAHMKGGQSQIKKGDKGYSQAEGKSRFQYEILDVVPQQKFSILWKTLFVRLIFIHEVKPIPRGSKISYRVEIRGLFARPLRWMLGSKIQKNIAHVLKTVARQLEGRV